VTCSCSLYLISIRWAFRIRRCVPIGSSPSDIWTSLSLINVGYAFSLLPWHSLTWYLAAAVTLTVPRCVVLTFHTGSKLRQVGNRLKVYAWHLCCPYPRDGLFRKLLRPLTMLTKNCFSDRSASRYVVKPPQAKGLSAGSRLYGHGLSATRMR